MDQHQSQPSHHGDASSSSSVNPVSFAATMLVPISATYPSFAVSGSSKLLNPTISDMELVWNWIKVGAYFGSLLLCLAPALSDAWKYPKTEEVLEDELSELLQLDEDEGNAIFGSQLSESNKNIKQSSADDKNSKKNKKGPSAPSRWTSLKAKVGKTAETVKATTLHSLRVALLFILISIFTYTTWSFIIRFLEEDRNRFIDFSQWIARSDWMTTSYKLVSLHPEQWFWSAQLLFFVVPMTLYMVIEHARSAVFYQRQIASLPAKLTNQNKKSKSATSTLSDRSTITEVVVEGSFSPFANLWLGCGLAISVCLPLALSSIMTSSWNSFGAMSSSPDKCHQIQSISAAAAGSKKRVVIVGVNDEDGPDTVSTRQKLRALRHSVPINVWFVLLPLAIAFMCVVMIPAANDTNFGYVLGGLHIFVVLPTIVAQFFPRFIAGPPQNILATSATATTMTAISSGATNSVRQRRSHSDRMAIQDEWKQRTAQALWIPVAFACFAASTLALHLINFLHVVGSVSANRLFATLFRGFCYNNCQCSISLDVVQCSLVVMGFIFFFLPSLSWHERVFLCCATPLLSLGFTFSCAIALEEMRVLTHRLTNDVEGFDQVFPEILFAAEENERKRSSNSNKNRHLKLSLKQSSSSTTATTTTATTTSTAKPASGRKMVVSPLTPEMNELKVSEKNSNTPMSMDSSFNLETPNKLLKNRQSQHVDDASLQNIAGKNKNKKSIGGAETAKRTYLDNEEDDDEELFNIANAQQALSSKTANRKEVVQRKQQPIKPVTAKNHDPHHHPHQRQLIIEEERTRKLVLVDQESDDDDNDEEEEEEEEEDQSNSTDEYVDDQSETSEGKSDKPRHSGDEESRSSGISGVYSEEGSVDSARRESDDEE